MLHVGTPKTGTSHLQDVLFRNRELLAEHGIGYPADRFDAHFLAALDLMDLPWGGLEGEAVGRWDALAAEVRAWSGTSIISHEILARATRPQIARALTDLGADDGVEIHLVITTRDLVRQIPAEWQENIKHRSTISYHSFLETIADPSRPGRIGSWFWAVQEIPDILERWGATLPPERVHVVTVPPKGAARDELWTRFSTAFGLDGLPLDDTAERANPSLGVAETTLVRRINQRVVAELPPAHYRPLVRELLAHQTLSQRTDSARLALSPEAHARARALSESWIAEIDARGYDVVGDLSDLLGADHVDFVDPDLVAEAEVNAAALDAIDALLRETVRLQDEGEQARHEAAVAWAEVDRPRARLGYRVKNKLYRTLDQSGVGRLALQVYRRARGRNSFEA